MAQVDVVDEHCVHVVITLYSYCPISYGPIYSWPYIVMAQVDVVDEHLCRHVVMALYRYGPI